MVTILKQAVTPFEEYANKLMKLRYSQIVHGRKEEWGDIVRRVVNNVMSEEILAGTGISKSIVGDVIEIMEQRKFIPGGRILAQAGKEYHQTDNCFCLRAEDNREGWAELLYKCTMMFMSGGGVGVDYSDIRPYGSKIIKSGGIASGSIPLIEAVNSVAAAVRQGGERRGACYASLPWDHKDVDSFIQLKSQRELAHTNISVMFNDDFFDKSEAGYYHHKYDVFLQTLQHAVQYGDPGFQFDRDNKTLRNACTEIISNDDCDSCCIGSVNFAAIDSMYELGDVVNLGVLFLLCNTLYTHKPIEKVSIVKEKNRRLGLGIMGIAEWFIQQRLPYGQVNDEFDSWMRAYQYNSNNAAVHWSYKLKVNIPVATRAIAPTGTISIVGGRTSPGMEPIFHTAYKRTYNTLKTQEYRDGYASDVTIESIALKLYEQGYDVRGIDTAYTLSTSIEGIKRRLAFQAYLQDYVDNGISSTVNLPKYDPKDNLAEKIAPVLLKYLPQLRGVTFYPDGAKDHQPVVPVDFYKAMGHKKSDNSKIEQYPSCTGGECGN